MSGRSRLSTFVPHTATSMTMIRRIAAHVTATRPDEASDLLWRMLAIAPSIYERCDDRNGIIGSVIASARGDLGAIAAEAGQPVGALADRVFAAVCANDYGQFDHLISLTAQALGPDGLNQLKTQFEELAVNVPMAAACLRRWRLCRRQAEGRSGTHGQMDPRDHQAIR